MTELESICILLAVVVSTIIIGLWCASDDNRDPATLQLSRELQWARRLRLRRRVIELHVFAMSRARGEGGWSVDVVFDGPGRERVQLGSGAPCERDFAAALETWGKRAAQELHVTADIRMESDC